MKKEETNSTDKTIEVEYTESDIEEMREKGVGDEDLPSVGVHKFRRSRFIGKRAEQKIKVTIMLDADVLDFYKKRSAETGGLPYQTQINQELRKAMEKSKSPQSKVVTLDMLEDPVFLSELANKLKKVA